MLSSVVGGLFYLAIRGAPNQGVPPMITPPVMSMKAARAYLGGRSESTLRDLIAAGKIKAVRDGGRILVVTASMDEYAATLPLAEVRPSHTRQK
jgi:excisionase family DNA binding protein